MAQGSGGGLAAVVILGVVIVGGFFAAPTLLAIGWMVQNDAIHPAKLPGQLEDWQIAHLSNRQLTLYYAQQDDEMIKQRYAKMTPDAVAAEKAENQREIDEQFNKKK